jgi:hypothetical protein
VIESTIPKSRKTALATILPPILLGTEAIAVLPSSVLQFNCKLSSLRLIIGALGIGASIDILLLVIWQVPELPSLKDRAMGTNASFVIDAHEVNNNNVNEEAMIAFMGFLSFLSIFNNIQA